LSTSSELRCKSETVLELLNHSLIFVQSTMDAADPENLKHFYACAKTEGAASDLFRLQYPVPREQEYLDGINTRIVCNPCLLTTRAAQSILDQLK
jgi:hypothetical protein